MSSSNAQYHAALSALALEIGANPEALSDRQTLVVGKITVCFSSVDDDAGAQIQCVCKVAPLPPYCPVETLRTILKANTLGPATAGATLALQHGIDDLILEQRHPVDIAPAALARACRAQVEASSTWAAALYQPSFQSAAI